MFFFLFIVHCNFGDFRFKKIKFLLYAVFIFSHYDNLPVDIDYKKKIVAGAGSGIGRATCICFAKENAKVIAVDKNADNVSNVKNALNGNSYTFFHLDKMLFHVTLCLIKTPKLTTIQKSIIFPHHSRN